jgi:hypothetical protein
MEGRIIEKVPGKEQACLQEKTYESSCRSELWKKAGIGPVWGCRNKKSRSPFAKGQSAA